MPRRYTTIVDFVDHWQTLLAGLIALIAAIITVFVTLNVERRKADREIDALRKSLAIELRQLIPRALGAHISRQKLSGKADRPITARMLESLSRAPVPIDYRANAHKIGLLEGDAMDVVIVYGLLRLTLAMTGMPILSVRSPRLKRLAKFKAMRSFGVLASEIPRTAPTRATPALALEQDVRIRLRKVQVRPKRRGIDLHPCFIDETGLRRNFAALYSSNTVINHGCESARGLDSDRRANYLS